MHCGLHAAWVMSVYSCQKPTDFRTELVTGLDANSQFALWLQLGMHAMNGAYSCILLSVGNSSKAERV
jgi:hypothetical protein